MRKGRMNHFGNLLRRVSFLCLSVLVLAWTVGCGGGSRGAASGGGQAEPVDDAGETGAADEEETGVQKGSAGSGNVKKTVAKAESGNAEKTVAKAGNGDGRMQVVATIFPQYDFARHIAGDAADVHMLLKPGEEVHSYEPTPEDIRKIQNCDLFIYTGGENDVWVENILSSVADKRNDGGAGPRAVRLLDLVDLLAEEHLEGMMPEKGEHQHGDGDQDHSVHEGPDGEGHSDHEDSKAEEQFSHESEEGHHHGHEEEPDEHVWTSPENCAVLIGRLTEIFCIVDPACADVYRGNGERYREEFLSLDREYRELAANARRNTIIFADRFPFRYLAEELGLTCYAAFSGCSAESEPSAATIAFLINKAVEEKVPVIFRIEFSNGNIARAVSEAVELKLKRQAEKRTAGNKGTQAAQETEKKAEASQQKDPEGAEASQQENPEKDPEDAEASQQENPEKDPEGAEASQSEDPGQDGGGDGWTGATIQVLQLHSCQNVTRDEFTGGESCLSLMRQNLEALHTALY